MRRTHSPDEIEQLILNSATEGNILPITSRCDARCIFCSHKNNPPDIDVISIGVRTMEEVTRTMERLDPRQVITIGESASSIIEGEPFTHPHFREILAALRSRFPHTPIAITTNGHHLTAAMVEFIDGLGGISLNISLNSASLEGRKLLMGDNERRAQQTIEGIKTLASRGIRYESSLVAMPHVTGWEDIRQTIQFLADNKTAAIRVNMPAIAGPAGREMPFDARTIHSQLREFIYGLSTEMCCPVLIEPSWVANLDAEVSGVLRDSPAWLVGIRRGDVILKINGREPRCRVEAWQMLAPRGAMRVVVRRDGRDEELGWMNPYDGGSGIAMEYDFDMGRAEAIRQHLLRQPGKTLLLASEFGHEVLQAVLRLLQIPGERAEAIAVKNLTYGGTIKAAGLLTADDYVAAYREWQAQIGSPLSQILVPVESFNSLGYDLKHRHYSQLEEAIRIPVALA
jgi:wyosine [tRNA(Phe)-imidazoG37] synthetase (radical SAM superfamily)